MKGCSLFVVALFLGACATPSQPGGPGAVSGGIQVPMGREFEIAVGQDAHVEGTSITIRFNGIIEDSRCPSDVQCVWAGNAVARLALSAVGIPGVDASLNTTLDPKVATYAGYRVRITGLKPVPRAGKPLPAGDYVAVLEVTPL